MGKLTEPRRRFLGKVKDFDDKVDRAINQKMLKYYLKGYPTFPWGSNVVNGQRFPNYLPVPQGSEN